ncbi:MAG: hypothetical protein DRI71_01585 [Bacteroidetes bacterium]|nr:MAG: hypothetical protein DRI71_01585 [Bacteroidota bacterium]
MNTRKIEYIEPFEDYLQKEVDWAVSVPFNERFEVFCKHLHTVYNLAGIDLLNYQAKKSIYYISDNEI